MEKKYLSILSGVILTLLLIGLLFSCKDNAAITTVNLAGETLGYTDIIAPIGGEIGNTSTPNWAVTNSEIDYTITPVATGITIDTDGVVTIDTTNEIASEMYTVSATAKSDSSIYTGFKTATLTIEVVTVNQYNIMNTNLSSVHYAAGLWVVISPGGTIGTSSNGTVWAVQEVERSVGLNEVHYGDGRWVVIGTGGTDSFLLSENGTEWKFRNTWEGASTNTVMWYTLRGIHYANGLWVAVATGGKVLTSTNSIVWELPTSGTTWDLNKVHYANGQWIAVGSGGTIVTSMDNGITWTVRTSGTTVNLGDVSYGDGLWIAVGSGGTVVTSKDGTAWTVSTSGTTNGLNKVHNANGLWVAVGDHGTVVTSRDGTTTWTVQASGTVQHLKDVYYGDNQWVVVGTDASVLSSMDGIVWIAWHLGLVDVGSAEIANLKDVHYANNLWVTIGETGTILTWK